MSDIIRIDGEIVEADSPDENPALVYLAGLAESGRRTMVSKLNIVAGLAGFDDLRSVPWHQLKHQHLVAIRTKLQEADYAPATINSTIYAIRGVMKSCFNLGLIDADELERIRAVKPVKGKRLPAGRAVTSGELQALMEACGNDDSAAGVRDAAAIALMYAAGLRRAEVAALDVQSYDATTGEIVVLGKGDKERLVYVDNGAADALSDWLMVLGTTDGPLFVPIDKGGNVHRGHTLSSQAIYNLLCKRAKEAGVRDVTCHDLRRSFVSDLLDAGADISTTAKLAGHSQLQTTATYDRRDEEAKKAAISLLHVPYRRREHLPLPEPKAEGDDG